MGIRKITMVLFVLCISISFQANAQEKDFGPFSKGDVLDVNGKLLVVGSEHFEKSCVRKDMKVRRRCRQAEIVDLEVDTKIKAKSGFVVNYRNQKYHCDSNQGLNECLRDKYGIILTKVADKTLGKDLSCNHVPGGSNIQCSDGKTYELSFSTAANFELNKNEDPTYCPDCEVSKKKSSNSKSTGSVILDNYLKIIKGAAQEK